MGRQKLDTQNGQPTRHAEKTHVLALNPEIETPGDAPADDAVEQHADEVEGGIEASYHWIHV